MAGVGVGRSPPNSSAPFPEGSRRCHRKCRRRKGRWQARSPCRGVGSPSQPPAPAGRKQSSRHAVVSPPHRPPSGIRRRLEAGPTLRPPSRIRDRLKLQWTGLPLVSAGSHPAADPSYRRYDRVELLRRRAVMSVQGQEAGRAFRRDRLFRRPAASPRSRGGAPAGGPGRRTR